MGEKTSFPLMFELLKTINSNKEENFPKFFLNDRQVKTLLAIVSKRKKERKKERINGTKKKGVR